jgi:hypothetical protein
VLTPPEAVRSQATAERRALEQITVRAVTWLALGLLPVAFALFVLLTAHGSPSYGLELRGNLVEPGARILAGESPYEPGYLHASREELDAGGEPLCCLQALYPAPVHVLASPLALLPFDLAMLLFVTGSLAALAGALWFVGVRDWRCYGIVLLAPPVVQGIKLGSVTPLLVLCCALAWRWRDRAWSGSAVAAAAIVMKVFLWPLLVSLLATRRFLATTRTALLATSALLVGWAAIGFADLFRYPEMLSDLAALEQGSGYSTVALGLAIGLTAEGARVIAVALGVLLLTFASRLDERRAFAITIVAALVLTPIVWQSYFTLLMLPLALVAPRLSVPWAVLLLFWLLPSEGSGLAHAALGHVALALTVAAVLTHGRGGEVASKPVPPHPQPRVG